MDYLQPFSCVKLLDTVCLNEIYSQITWKPFVFITWKPELCSLVYCQRLLLLISKSYPLSNFVIGFESFFVSGSFLFQKRVCNNNSNETGKRFLLLCHIHPVIFFIMFSVADCFAFCAPIFINMYYIIVFSIKLLSTISNVLSVNLDLSCKNCCQWVFRCWYFLCIGCVLLLLEKVCS